MTSRNVCAVLQILHMMVCLSSILISYDVLDLVGHVLVLICSFERGCGYSAQLLWWHSLSLNFVSFLSFTLYYSLN